VQVFSLAIILQIILKAASYTHHSSQTGMASQIQAFTIFSTSHTVDRQLPRPTGRERASFGKLTVSTPFLNCVSACSRSAFFGSWMRRSTVPYERSKRCTLSVFVSCTCLRSAFITSDRPSMEMSRSAGSTPGRSASTWNLSLLSTTSEVRRGENACAGFCFGILTCDPKNASRNGSLKNQSLSMVLRGILKVVRDIVVGC
jgi:hypothetical protein